MESEEVAELIEKYNPHAKIILDVGCGSGKHSVFLSAQFDVDGIDVIDEFVSIATLS